MTIKKNRLLKKEKKIEAKERKYTGMKVFLEEKWKKTVKSMWRDIED